MFGFLDNVLAIYLEITMPVFVVASYMSDEQCSPYAHSTDLLQYHEQHRLFNNQLIGLMYISHKQCQLHKLCFSK